MAAESVCLGRRGEIRVWRQNDEFVSPSAPFKVTAGYAVENAQ